MAMNKPNQHGYTLLELLVVTIILAIVAVIVVPQIASLADNTKFSALDSNLASIRSAVERYYQHHGVYPGLNQSKDGPACPSGGIKGTGEANSERSFIDQLTGYSSAAGYTCTTTDAAFRYGPYFRRDTLPPNPLTGDDKLIISTAGTLLLEGAATAAGWKFDTITGRFIADDAANDDR